MAYRIMTIALGLAVMAAPAAARTNAEQKAKTAAADAEKKYCIAFDNVVGSRITKTECKTKAEWAKDHVNVDQMMKD